MRTRKHSSFYGASFKLGAIYTIIAIVVALCADCSNPNSQSKFNTLWVNQTSGTFENSRDSIHGYNQEYLKLKLGSVSSKTGKYYIATQEIKAFSLTTGEAVNMAVTEGQSKETKQFTDASTFLNYIASCGYDLVTEVPTKYGGTYTFKRK